MKEHLKFNNNIEELKEAEEQYYQSLNLEGIVELEHPSLKYAAYNIKISNVFIKKIAKMKAEIEEIKERLKSHKSEKFDKEKKEMDLDNIYNKLNDFEKKEDEDQKYYEHYLIYVAKRSDLSKNKEAEAAYIATSEGVIKLRIQYFLKCEKYFILYYDILNQLKNLV